MAYASAGFVVAGDDYLLLLHSERLRTQSRVLILKHRGVEAVLAETVGGEPIVLIFKIVERAYIVLGAQSQISC